MSGRVLGEAIIACIAAVVLAIILGLRYLAANSTGQSSNASNRFAGIVTSSLFLTLLFALIIGAIAAIELRYRLRRARSPDG